MSTSHFYSVNDYLKEKYGTKIYRIAINGHMSCPNRDGSCGHRGCIFCSEGGSGEFAQDSLLSITEQINNGKKLLQAKYQGNSYIAYFQAFTNTYAPIEYLEKIFYEAINHPDIVILSIATRPDCLDDSVIQLLSKLNQIKPVWIELGLQTIHESTATYIRRGYPLKTYDLAMNKLTLAGITTIVHMIIGLPGETKEMMLETAQYIAASKADGIKLSLLHVLKNTDLATDFYNNYFKTLELDEYIDILIDIIKILPPDMVIHRLTGDGPKSLLIAPLWSGNKKVVLNSIHKAFRDRLVYQGSDYNQRKDD